MSFPAKTRIRSKSADVSNDLDADSWCRYLSPGNLRAPSRSTTDAAVDGDSLPPSPSRILLIEDQPDDAALIGRLLKKSFPGVHCGLVQSREELCGQLDAETWDVIVSDYALKNWTGLDAFVLTRELGQQVPFILMTGALGDETAVECIKIGMADYVLKDRPDRLATAISRALKDEALTAKQQKTAYALEQSELRLRLMADTIPAATFIEQGTRCCYANRAAESITGYDRSELLNMTFWDMILPDSRKSLTGMVDAADPSSSRYEIQIKTKIGDVRCLDVTVAMFQNNGQLAALITALDITERQRRETNERRLLEDQSRQSQKMEAVGRLSGGIAHDFNNLLGVIILHAECLREDVDKASALRGGIDEIVIAANRAASLTRQLLAFSRQQVLDSKPLDLRSVVSEMKKLLSRLIGEDIELTTIHGPGPLTVRADQGQLEQIIMNLAVNARDAMPGGGKLSIETRKILLDSDAIKRCAYPLSAGEYACLSVTDTGVGMDEHTKAHAFEPFFTTKDKGKGTGLGLATVYGVVKQSGGHVELLSSPEVGTAFNVYLPLIDGPVPSDKPASTGAISLYGDETILVVEDEASLSSLVRSALISFGYTVLCAKNGVDGLCAAQAHAGKIDLLLTDMVMPEMSGRVLAQELSRTRPELVVVYMSGYTGPAARFQEAVEEGTHFLAKPFTRTTLVRKVRQALDRPSRSNLP